MISFDAECMSRLAYAMLQSCLHGTITGFILYNPVFRGPAVYLAYTYLFFVLCSFRWGKRVSTELQHIQLRVQDFSQMYTASFFVLQLYMWYLGYKLYKTRKYQLPQTLPPDLPQQLLQGLSSELPQDQSHLDGGTSRGFLVLHSALCSVALFKLVRKMTK
jgi:hypothetical protein